MLGRPLVCAMAIALTAVRPSWGDEAPTPSDGDEPIEVTVEGEPRAEDSKKIDKSEIRSLPGAFGDPFRAIEALPGVTPIASGVPYFFVRGAPPGNVGYYFDGVRVPALYHVGLGPGVIHPVLVDAVALYPGAYPARYGRYAGGIVTADAAPAIHDWRGEASIRVFDLGAMLNAPLPPDARGSVSLSGRYSYTAAILSLLNPDVKLDYWDYQSRIHYRVGPRDDVSLLLFGAGDFLAQKGQGGEENETIVDGSFHRLDFRWDHRPSAKTTVRVATTLGLDFVGSGSSGLRDRSLGFRSELGRQLGGGARLSAGADANVDAYDTATSAIDPQALPVEDTGFFDRLFAQNRRDLSSGLWMELEQPLGPATFTPGLRLDYFAFGGVTALSADPRLALSVRANDDVRILSTVGVAHQPPSFVVAIPGLAVRGEHEGLQRSLQQSLGIEVDLPHDVKSGVTLFQNTFFNATDPLAVLRSAEARRFSVLDRTMGSARGVEVHFQRPITHRIGGFVSYTLSRSERVLGRERFVSAFDRTHVLQAAVSHDLGRRWRAGTRVVFYSGVPAAKLAPSGVEKSFQPEDPGRTLPFFRVDLRLEKRWIIAERGWVALVFEVLNTLARREVVDVQCNALRRCEPIEIGPIIIPSIGVEGGF